jgi:hypothetical protein
LSATFLLPKDGDNLLRRVEVDAAGRAGLLGLEREHIGSLVRQLTWRLDSRGLPVSSSEDEIKLECITYIDIASLRVATLHSILS